MNPHPHAIPLLDMQHNGLDAADLDPAGLDAAGVMDVMGQAMDGPMGLDDVDLFGDPVMNNALALPTRPLPSRQLQLRLDQLRTRTCCQGIAWSRTGTIASIGSDGTSVDVRFLRCHPKNASWGLSEPVPLTSVSSSSGAGGPITHLTWSPTLSHSDLAVIDQVGRVQIFNFSTYQNKCLTTRRFESDPVDDLHAVVGTFWLNPTQSRERLLLAGFWPATLTRDDYEYKQRPGPVLPPSHPVPGKSALVCVTTNGLIRLFYTQNSNRVEETSHELESPLSTDDLITHASVRCDKGQLLIALATETKQLKILRVGIKWNLPHPGDKQMPPGSIPLDPTFTITRLVVTSWYQPELASSPLDACMAQLSHLEVLPSTLKPNANGQYGWQPPIILAVRSYLPTDPSSPVQDVQSIVDRWEMVPDKEQALHPAFAQLGARAGQAPGPSTAVLLGKVALRKLEAVTIPKIIMSVDTSHSGLVLCFICSDGTVLYHDRLTMEEVFNEPNHTSISSMHQVGFHYPDPTPCLQAVFSPSHCSFVQICEDGKMKWNKLQLGVDDTKGHKSKAVLAGLITTISTPFMLLWNYDDLLAVARPVMSDPDEFASAFVKEIAKMGKYVVDYTDEMHESGHEYVARDANLFRFLGIVSHFGFSGEFEPRSFGGRFAMLALNLRSVMLLLTIAQTAQATTSQLPLREKLNPYDDPEAIDTIAGCTRWLLDLFGWLSDSLFCLLDDNDGGLVPLLRDPARFGDAVALLRRRGDVSLHMLLCSSTRGFLVAACRRLTNLFGLTKKAMQYRDARRLQPEAQDRLMLAYTNLFHIFRDNRGGQDQVEEFEKLIKTMGQRMRAIYKSKLVAAAAAAGAKASPGHSNTTNNTHNNNKDNKSGPETEARRAQQALELELLLGGGPPSPDATTTTTAEAGGGYGGGYGFREMLLAFFQGPLHEFRARSDQAELYFANFAATLELDDGDSEALRAREAATRYVDVFRRVELFSRKHSRYGDGDGAARRGRNDDGGGGGHSSRSHQGQAGIAAVQPGGSVRIKMWHEGGGGGSNGDDPLWRRCVRCCNIMEDVLGTRPGLTYLVSHQRKCSCGGNWGLLLNESLVL